MDKLFVVFEEDDKGLRLKQAFMNEGDCDRFVAQCGAKDIREVWKETFQFNPERKNVITKV